MTTVSLSFVTLVRNRNTMLRHLVHALARSARTDVELVVVRAGGTEDPSDVVPDEPAITVRIVDLGSCSDGIPYSNARNAGARAASSDLLCFLDADMVPSASLAGSIIGCLRVHDVLARGEVRYLAPGVDAGDSEYFLHTRSLPHPAQAQVPAFGIRLGGAHELVWGQYFALRRATFEHHGGFDEGYCGYAGEDTDLAERLRRSGVGVALVGNAVAFHQQHDWFDPPVQQLRATVANARRFRRRLGYWPMEGWLSRFEELGLVARTDDTCEVLTEPSPELIEHCRRRLPPPYVTSGG